MDKPKRGRKPDFGVPMRRLMVTLDSKAIERARQIGHGNVSAGIRTALERREKWIADALIESARLMGEPQV